MTSDEILADGSRCVRGLGCLARRGERDTIEAMSQPESANVLGRVGKRVAFFGGSFDPPHLGHLAVARAARAAFRLDTVLFAPVGVQPLKPEGSTASFEQRLAMTRMAIEGEPGFAISLADAPKAAGAPNYTLETIEKLRAALAPDCMLYCLMGADSFFGMRGWHRAAELGFAAPLIVASRPGQPLGEMGTALPEGLELAPAPEAGRNECGVEVRAFILTNKAGDSAPFYLLPGLDVEISASEIRERIRDGVHIEAGSAQGGLVAEQALIPDAVREYILAHGLYR
jgi:nicotinate-nucleotide adenylyltransferase